MVANMKKDARPKLRCAIMCDGMQFRQWQANCILEMVGSEQAEIVLLIMDPKKQKDPAGLPNRLLGYPYNNLLYKQYEKRVLNKIPALKKVDLRSDLANVAVLECDAERKGPFTDVISATDCAQIRSYNLDFIVRFAFNILRGEILTTARRGVWSYHHSDPGVFRGGPAGFWEIYQGKHATGVVLQQLTHEIDNGAILREGKFKTINHSYTETLNTILFGATGWVQQACLDMVHGVNPKPPRPHSEGKPPMNKVPGNFQFLIFLIKLWMNKMKFQLHDLFRSEKWNIGVIEQPVHEVALLGITKPVRWAKELRRGKYIADAFLSIEASSLQSTMIMTHNTAPSVQSDQQKHS
jgi:hypothetical protein